MNFHSGSIPPPGNNVLYAWHTTQNRNNICPLYAPINDNDPVMPLLRIQNLSVDFISSGTVTAALKNISFTVNKGKTLALVGESGSGKSVTALSILQLLASPPAVYKNGQIIFSENDGREIDILKAGTKEIQDIRGHKIAMIFQEPMTSLNPVLTCGNQVMESLLRHKKISTREARQQTLIWLEKVKLPDPALIFSRYPHQLSGGQKQRVMIAMAMCCHPSLLICDEPTTALDVTVQKAILDLIKELQQQQDMGVIFITHDLGVVAGSIKSLTTGNRSPFLCKTGLQASNALV